MTTQRPRHDRRQFLHDSALATIGLAGVVGQQSGTALAARQELVARSTTGSKSLSRQFAECVVRLRYEDLPADVVDRAKGLTLQNISSALLGAQLPAGPTRREDIGDARPGSTRYYSAYGVVKRGFPMLPGTPDPPEVRELMKRVTIIPSHRMTLFGPFITIFTKDGKIAAGQFEQLIATCRDLDREPAAATLVRLTLKN